MKVYFDFVSKRPDIFTGKSYTYGTYSTGTQDANFRLEGDTDNQLFVSGGKAEKYVNELVEAMNKVRPSDDFKFKTAKDAPLTIINTKTGETAFDIHDMNRKIISDKVPQTTFGRNVLQPVVKYEDAYFSRLSGEGQAKSSSIFSITENFKEIGFAPKSGRSKDIDDTFTIQKKLSKNLADETLNPDNWFNKLTGKTNKAKSDITLKKIEELESKYPKQKIKDLDDAKNPKLLQEQLKMQNLADAKGYFKAQKKITNLLGKSSSGMLSNLIGNFGAKTNRYSTYDSSSSAKYSPMESYKPSKSMKSAEKYSPAKSFLIIIDFVDIFLLYCSILTGGVYIKSLRLSIPPCLINLSIEKAS
jgi:hypothetical protein